MKKDQEVKNIETNIVEDVTPNKAKKKLSKKQKGIIISIIAVILIIAIGIGGYFIYQNSRKIDLISDIKIIEYGEKYEPNVSDFVEERSINDTYTINGEISNEVEKDYPAIGEYTFTISAKNKDNVEVTVKVEDTTSPVFDENSPSEISTFKDVPITEEILKNTFTVNDLSSVNISIDDVDYATVGEYTTNIYATDSSGNIANKEIKVIIKEPTINIEQANISLTVGETATLNATVQGASQTVTWTSSDTSIASVDENGVITAVKEGTATVEAEANGTKTSVTVAVMRKNSSSNGSTSSNSSQGNSRGNNNTSSNSGNVGASSSGSSGSSGSSSGSSGSSSEHKHSRSTGDIGLWFNSRTELENYVTNKIQEWRTKRANGEITLEEYNQYAPTGYEAFTCSGCGMWTGNYKYR